MARVELLVSCTGGGLVVLAPVLSLVSVRRVVGRLGSWRDGERVSRREQDGPGAATSARVFGRVLRPGGGALLWMAALGRVFGACGRREVV